MKIRSFTIFALAMVFAIGAWAAEDFQKTYNEGMALYKKRKYKEAAPVLAEAVKLATKTGEKYQSMYYQSVSLQRSRKYPEALKISSELMKLEGLSPKQKDSAFSQNLHNIYYTKQYKEVVDIADKILADDKASNYQKIMSCYLGYLSCIRMKKYDQAIEFGKKLADYDKNPKSTWNARSMIYPAQASRYNRKYQQALDYLPEDEIKKMNPYRQYDAYIEKSYSNSALKKYDEAAAEAKKAITATDNKGQIAVGTVILIEALNTGKKYEEAMAYEEQIPKIKSQYWRARGLMRLGQNLQKQGKLDEARKKYEEVLKLKTDKRIKRECQKGIQAIEKAEKAKK